MKAHHGVLALLLSFACTSTSPGGISSGGGTTGMGGSTGVGGATASSPADAAYVCPCPSGNCPTLEVLNQVLATFGGPGPAARPPVPSTVEGAVPFSKMQIGCGLRLVYEEGGVDEGYGYVFDLTTGALVGASVFDDVSFSGCSLSEYRWGDTSLFRMYMQGGMNCPDKVQCTANGDPAVYANWTCPSSPADAAGLDQAIAAPQADAGGTRGSGGSDGAAETEGGLSTCAADETVTAAQTPTRRVLPWTLVLPKASGGAGGLAPDGGTAGTSGSGCTVQGGPPLVYEIVTCQGTASVLSNTGPLELAFDDSSILSWDTTGIINPVQAPVLNGLGSVWVDYSYSANSACGPPACATFTRTELYLRDREGGSLLWVGREGDQADDVSDALVSELFGVVATRQPFCQFEFTAECQDTIRTLFNHVLQTTPAQVLQHARIEHVVTPNGQYQVVWAYSQETHTPVYGYCEAVHLPHDRGFAASRI